MGESLSRMAMFLFGANFFYKFAVYPANPLNPPPPSKQKFGGFMMMSEYDCKIEVR